VRPHQTLLAGADVGGMLWNALGLLACAHGHALLSAQSTTSMHTALHTPAHSHAHVCLGLCMCCRDLLTMEQPGQQQWQLQEQAAQLIASLPGLLAGESEESFDDAVAAVSRLPVGVCAGLLQLPEPARRRAVLRHARAAEPGGP
jgi:hypothetical protein